MYNLQEKLEKLLSDAEGCTGISKLAADAADRVKGQMFAQLAENLGQMAADIEGVIAVQCAIAGKIGAGEP
jgi:hypothetical protein